MNEVYYDARNPAGFAGARPLARQFGAKTAVDWLKTQDAYTLHKPLRKKFPRRKTFAKGVNDLF